MTSISTQMHVRCWIFSASVAIGSLLPRGLSSIVWQSLAYLLAAALIAIFVAAVCSFCGCPMNTEASFLIQGSKYTESGDCATLMRLFAAMSAACWVHLAASSQAIADATRQIYLGAKYVMHR
eukprot:3228782-Pleurochrysis_carterae.AAC.1